MLQRGHITEPDGRVVAAARQELAAGRESECFDVAGMTFQLCFFGSSLRVPDSDGPVAGGGSNPCAIGCVNKRFDASGVTFERCLEFARLDVPQPYRFIDTGAGENLLVR